MKNSFPKKYITTHSIVAYSLGFVMLWFGLNELIIPKNWVGFVPEFLANMDLANVLILIHGFLLTACGLGLLFKKTRRVAAVIVSLMMFEIVVDILIQGIAMDIIVRDVGILGMALSLIP